jgi:hypothetical protein
MFRAWFAVFIVAAAVGAVTTAAYLASSPAPQDATEELPRLFPSLKDWETLSQSFRLRVLSAAFPGRRSLRSLALGSGLPGRWHEGKTTGKRGGHRIRFAMPRFMASDMNRGTPNRGHLPATVPPVARTPRRLRMPRSEMPNLEASRSRRGASPLPPLLRHPRIAPPHLPSRLSSSGGGRLRLPAGVVC